MGDCLESFHPEARIDTDRCSCSSFIESILQLPTRFKLELFHIQKRLLEEEKYYQELLMGEREGPGNTGAVPPPDGNKDEEAGGYMDQFVKNKNKKVSCTIIFLGASYGCSEV